MPLVSESPAATFRGIEPEAQFGAAVSAAGDVDADGYDDVAVASPYEGTRAGAVRVFRGGAVEAEALAWVTLPAGAGDETFGQALAGAGDLDGDGFDDLAVGAPATLDDSGRLHVFLGGPDGPSPAPSATVEAPEPGSYFAFALSVAGDLDGDALDDLWVGAFRYGVGIGTAIRYAGAADGAVLERADAAIGASTNSNFGQAVAGGGDLDGDGVPDLAVGAPRARSEAGELSVFAGAPALDPEPYAGAAGDARDARLGTALAMGGDVDADGLGDLVVGIPNGADYSGVATLFLGTRDGIRAARSWSGPREDSHLGYALAIAGDLDGDGLADIALGIGDATLDDGAAWLVRGARADLAEEADQVLAGPGGESHFGSAITSAGDVDGDGCDDLLVGAGNADAFTGRAFLYTGIQAEAVEPPDTGDPGDSGGTGHLDSGQGDGESGSPGADTSAGGVDVDAAATEPPACECAPGSRPLGGWTAMGLTAWMALCRGRRQAGRGPAGAGAP